MKSRIHEGNKVEIMKTDRGCIETDITEENNEITKPEEN